MKASHIRILESPAAEERLLAARQFLASFPPGSELLLIGASREAIDDLARQEAVRAGATLGWHRFTLHQLAWKLAESEVGQASWPVLLPNAKTTGQEACPTGGLAPVSRLGSEAVAARAAFETQRAGRLRYFSPVSGAPGFARSLASTLDELRMAGITPADLAGRLAKVSAAAGDIGVLLERYQEELASLALADRAELLRAAEKAAAGHWIGERPILLLDVRLHTAAERNFARTLAARSPSVLITVPAGDELTRQAFPDAVSQTTRPSSPNALGRLRRYIFQTEQPPAGEAGEEVVFFSAPGEARECVEVVRRILEEGRAGTPFDQMAVLTRTPETYAAVLEAALERAGVPSYFTRGAKRPDPAGRAFLALLGCAAQGLSARAFAEYLSLGQVPDPNASGAPPESETPWVPAEDEILGRRTLEPEEVPEAQPHEDDDRQPHLAGTLRAPWNWEKLLVEASVIGGKDRWARRLKGLAKDLTLRIEELGADESDSARRTALERDIRNLGHLSRFALPLIEHLAALPANAKWGDWLAAFQTLAVKSLRHPTRVLEVLAELRPMSEMGPVSLLEVREVLRVRLATLPQQPPDDRYGRVFVAPLEHARGRSFEVVFVPGMAERMFPLQPREDPLLLDDLRADLSRPADRLATLPDQQRRSADERLLLRLAVGAARRRVVLSYPRMQMRESRPRVPSFYALDVLRAVTGRVPDYRELEHEAAQEARARLAWPAPAQPDSAIDEAEHDLAMLERSTGQLPGGESRKGAAQYLLELNQNLARSLRTRYARWEQPGWRPADGLVSQRPEVLRAIEEHRLRKRAYSVSALQKFAACPYQFLLAAIHRLEPREEIVALERLDPLTSGNIFHRVQAAVLRELQQSESLPVDESRLKRALWTVDSALNLVAAKFEEDLAPAIARVWTDGIEALRADLRGWIQQLAEAKDGWLPTRFEFGFGLPRGRHGGDDAGRDPESPEQPAKLPDGFLLRGAIDLIESRQDGSLRVTDHKTGANRHDENLLFGAGEVLQPVLYALAAEALLGKPVTHGRLYFCTAKAGFSERLAPIDPLARAAAVQILQAIDDAVGGAFLPAAPRPGACGFCDFREVCGPYEEIRAGRKDATRMDDLKWLRELR